MQRKKACISKDQNPLLESAVFYCLLYTRLRESELASLNYEQYHHRGFHEVKRKGAKVTRKVPLPTEARDKLDLYLDSRVGERELSESAPLFITRYGNRLHPRGIYRITQRICKQANVSGEAIRLTPTYAAAYLFEKSSRQARRTYRSGNERECEHKRDVSLYQTKSNGNGG